MYTNLFNPEYQGFMYPEVPVILPHDRVDAIFANSY